MSRQTIFITIFLTVSCTAPEKPQVEAPPEVQLEDPTPGRHLLIWGEEDRFYGIAPRSDRSDHWLLYRLTSFYCGPWNEAKLTEDRRRTGTAHYQLVVDEWFQGGPDSEVFTGTLFRNWAQKPAPIKQNCHLGGERIGPPSLSRVQLNERFFVFGTQQTGYALKHDGLQINIHRILVPWSEAHITGKIDKGLWFEPQNLAQHDLFRGHFDFPADDLKAPKPEGKAPPKASAHLKVGAFVLSTR